MLYSISTRKIRWIDAACWDSAEPIKNRASSFDLEPQREKEDKEKMWNKEKA